MSLSPTETRLLDRIVAGMHELNRVHGWVDLGKLVLHAHPMTLGALAREHTGSTNLFDGLTLKSVAGIPVCEDHNIAPSRLVLRFEVDI